MNHKAIYPIIFCLVFTVGLLFILLLAHIFSLAFGYGWALHDDSMGITIVIGILFGLFLAIWFFVEGTDD